jgi:uncharacterized protein (TIGR00288 family)
MKINMKDKDKIAVFIDADNAPADKFYQVLSELARSGVVNIRKAYGNWTKANLASWQEVLHEYAIQPMQQFDLTKGKNASDIALVIDVMDVLHSKDIDIVCLVSSDCDFTPLVTRILAEGKSVIGFGERKSPTPFVNSCSRFLYFEEEKGNTPEKEEPNNKKSLCQNTRLIKLLREAAIAVEDDDGWAMLGPLGTHISNHTSFDQRNYGFKKLSDLFRTIDLFEMKQTHGTVLWVRDKKRAKQFYSA